MSRSLLPLCLLAASAALPAGLDSVRTVYFLPMSNGLDQYMANRLAAEKLFEVVTDPKLADAVFTDQIGQSFERRLEELLPPEKPPVAEDKEADKQDKDGKEASGKESLPAGSARMGEGYATRLSTFSRGKGNVFLVDLKSRRVIWSAFERPRPTSPDQLDKTSGQIITRLKKTLGKS
jgi:hypothetical protein